MLKWSLFVSMLKLFKWCNYILVLIMSETWYNVALLNVTVSNEAVVKRVNCIWEMSQNDDYFNRRGVTKRSCGCKLMFHFDNVSWAAAATRETYATGGKATGKHMHNMGRLDDDAKWKLDCKACVNGSTFSFGNIYMFFIYCFAIYFDYHCLPFEIVLFGDCSA